MKTKSFEPIRDELMEIALKAWSDAGYDVLITGSQERVLPLVDAKGEEGYLKVTFAIPKGDRDGEAYDGYAMAEEYERKMAEKAAKAAKAAADKKAKMERDAAARAAKKAAKEAAQA